MNFLYKKQDGTIPPQGTESTYVVRTGSTLIDVGSKDFPYAFRMHRLTDTKEAREAGFVPLDSLSEPPEMTMRRDD